MFLKKLNTRALKISLLDAACLRSYRRGKSKKETGVFSTFCSGNSSNDKVVASTNAQTILPTAPVVVLLRLCCSIG